MKNIIKLMRVKHWIKNFLIFLPAFFDGNVRELNILSNLLIGFLSFCLISSIIYINNDLKDVEKDRVHEIKCKRPIASGAVSEKKAKIVILILVVVVVCLSFQIKCDHPFIAVAWALGYIVINVAYSMGMKNIPLVDIAILAMGFIIRVFYGAAIANVSASSWLCLTVMAFALYMGIGKRRNELYKVQDGRTRGVLKYYDVELLDKDMTIVTTLGIVFYSLWAGTVVNNPYIIWTVPLVLFIIMRYEMIIKNNSYGDPVEVLLSDKILICLVILYGIAMAVLFYGF